MKKDVSIIIPAYQAERFIKRAINSCITQSGCSYELIIINDGSTDKTRYIVEQFSDARIMLINKKNEGVGLARNDGIKVASGKYVMFLDADDYLPSNCFKKIIASAVKSDVDFVFTDYSIESCGGLSEAKAQYDDSLSLIDNFYIDNIISSPWAKLFKLKLIKSHNIKFENFMIMQDSVFNLQYLSIVSSGSFLKVDDSSYVYNKLSGGTTDKINEKKIKVIKNSLNEQEKVYLEYKSREGLRVDNRILSTRRLLLEYLFVAQSSVEYVKKKMTLSSIFLMLINPFLTTRSKVELIFYVSGRRGYRAFLYFIFKLKLLLKFLNK
jgi:glycosyltransferase involved in cell wall biosynthesis